MTCLFIVDDNIGNARALGDALLAELPGLDQAVCVQGLAEFRQQRRVHKPGLVLVDLMRHQSNGFTLAAAITRLVPVPVVLITDRQLPSDQLWASARGIRHVLSRRVGCAALAKQLRLVLQQACPADGVVKSPDRRPRGHIPAPDHESASLPNRVLDELITSPESVLLECIAEDLREWPAEVSAGFENTRTRHWQNLLPFISDPAVCAALAGFIEVSHHDDAWLPARECLCSSLTADAGAVLLRQSREFWQLAGPQLQTEVSASGVYWCRDLLNALSFMPMLSAPGAQSVRADTCAVAGLSLPELLERVCRVLSYCEHGDDLQTLVSSECLRVLRLYLAGGPDCCHPALSKHGSCSPGWRELAGLCLMLRSLSAPSRWQVPLQRCLQVLYGGADRAPLASQPALQEHLLYLTLSMLDDKPIGPDEPIGIDASSAGASALLSEEISQQLGVLLTHMVDVMGRTLSGHQRLSTLMVSVYKLRSLFEIMPDAEVAAPACQRWRLIIGCLYSIVCHGVLQTGLFGRIDLKHLQHNIQLLWSCQQQGVLPADTLLMNLAAQEISIAGRSRNARGHEHQLLAAGLHRLPQPDGIVSVLPGDIRQSGTVLSEIIHELQVLTEGARGIGVRRVESLSKLMLDCYQQLLAQPGLLERKTLRLALVRAHRVLCRLLDQAAAWLPLDQPGTGQSVAAVIDDLFTQFDHAAFASAARGAGFNPLTQSAPDGSSYAEPGQVAWERALSLNRRLRQLIRQPGNLSEYRSLLAELLQEQQAVIMPYLCYQSPD